MEGGKKEERERAWRQDDFLRETILHGLVCLEKIMEPSFDGYRFFSPLCERERETRVSELYCAILENVKKLKKRTRAWNINDRMSCREYRSVYTILPLSLLIFPRRRHFAIGDL